MIEELITAGIKGHLCIRTNEIASEAPAEFPLEAIVKDRDRIYLQRNWVIETTLLKHLRRLREAVPRPLESFVFPKNLSPAQEEVIRWAASHSVTMVSGGPGTGKTFTAAELVKAFSGMRIKIAAPTGKAADRLVKAIGRPVEAGTLHRLLGLAPGRNRIFKNELLDADLILVDEASMIDASLFAHLFAAVPSGARLVLLGDADQLPPIQGGGVYSDLCAISAIYLDRCHRIENQELHALYDAARRGDAESFRLEPLGEDLIDLFDQALPKSSFEERPDPRMLFDHFDEARVLCPLRKGPLGVDAINRALLERREKRGRWRCAPILITGNDAQLKIYNGTAGIVLGQEAFFPDGRSIPLGKLPGYEVAFALSVHKSQGSEFKTVLCCLPPGSEEFGKRALYTAVTRAKREVRFFGSKETLEALMAKESRQENGIKDRFKAECGEGSL